MNEKPHKIALIFLGDNDGPDALQKLAALVAAEGHELIGVQRDKLITLPGRDADLLSLTADMISPRDILIIDAARPPLSLADMLPSMSALIEESLRPPAPDTLREAFSALARPRRTATPENAPAWKHPWECHGKIRGPQTARGGGAIPRPVLNNHIRNYC